MIANRRLALEIRTIFKESEETYGSPRIYRELRARGETVGENRVARLMQSEGIQARQPTAWRRTTDSRHDCPIAENIVNRDFVVDRPNQIWASDTTYIATPEGWLFLIVVLDLFSRRIVGWSLGSRLDGQLACDAFRSAASTRDLDGPLLFHTDRGVEFACDAFQKLLRAAGGIPSMSRRGDCWDNAVVESFFSTLKTELIYRRSFANRDEAKRAVFRYIEGFYNRRRRHSTIGYLSPVQFEEQTAA